MINRIEYLRPALASEFGRDLTLNHSFVAANDSRISHSRQTLATDTYRCECHGRHVASLDVLLQSVANRIVSLLKPIFGSHTQRTQCRYLARIANMRMPPDSGSCSGMRPEIAELVELLARAAYQRWRAGDFPPSAAFSQVDRAQSNQLPKATPVAYDHPGPTPTTELLGCASTPTPDTARIDKLRRR